MAIKWRAHSHAHTHTAPFYLSKDGTIKITQWNHPKRFFVFTIVMWLNIHHHHSLTHTRTNYLIKKQLKFIWIHGILERISSRTTRSPECIGIRSLVNYYYHHRIDANCRSESFNLYKRKLQIYKERKTMWCCFAAATAAAAAATTVFIWAYNKKYDAIYGKK